MERGELLRDTASVLSTTLNMIVNDYDRLPPAEIRKLASFAKYEADRLIEVLYQNPDGSAVLAERW